MTDLSKAAGVSVSTIKRIEDEDGSPSPESRSLIRQAFEQVGVVFAINKSLGEGVWFKRIEVHS